MRNNGNNPEILRAALVSVLGSLSAYYEDRIDVPYERTKIIASKINDKFNLNIDIDSIFLDIEDPEDYGCGHDQDDNYFDSILDRL